MCIFNDLIKKIILIILKNYYLKNEERKERFIIQAEKEQKVN